MTASDQSYRGKVAEVPVSPDATKLPSREFRIFLQVFLPNFNQFDCMPMYKFSIHV